MKECWSVDCGLRPAFSALREYFRTGVSATAFAHDLARGGGSVRNPVGVGTSYASFSAGGDNELESRDLDVAYQAMRRLILRAEKTAVQIK